MELKINLIEYNKWKHQNNYEDMDSYSGCVFRYAERWAELMEEQIEDDDTEIVIFNKLLHCADDLSFKANTESITGNQHYMARSILRQVWKYGDIFKQAYKYHDWKQHYDWQENYERLKEEEVE